MICLIFFLRITTIVFQHFVSIVNFYEQVLLGSMAALSLMTIVSVIIGRIFQSVPAQFQTS
jgi:putative Ca2+/H+ antiporter (TMEM165/GDT1 family)